LAQPPYAPLRWYLSAHGGKTKGEITTLTTSILYEATPNIANRIALEVFASNKTDELWTAGVESIPVNYVARVIRNHTTVNSLPNLVGYAIGLALYGTLCL
jgi:hypothetical protein